MNSSSAHRIADLQLEVAKYEVDIEEKNNLIKALKDSIAQKDHLNSELQLRVNHTTYTVDELRQALSEKDEKLRQLEV